MLNNTLKCLIVSDHNVQNFAGILRNSKEIPSIDPVTISYTQFIMNIKEETFLSTQHWDMIVVWTMPESISLSYKSLILGERISVEQLHLDVQKFVDLITNLEGVARFVLLPVWVTTPDFVGGGLSDLQACWGISYAIMKMNIQLAETLKNSVYSLLDINRLIGELSVERVYHPKLWYAAQIPYTNLFYHKVVEKIKNSLRGLFGGSKKAIVIDLDNTLWGGNVGDLGWEKLRLGGHDSVGEAYKDFQFALKAIKNRGILLGIISKNEESVALEAIQKHPEMVLRLDDFAAWKINWHDKAKNLFELAEDLNIGLDSIVFIDDNSFERQRIREALPEVAVPDWPNDVYHYRMALSRLSYFDFPIRSDEDSKRTQMYASEFQRVELKRKLASYDEWLSTLNIKVSVEPLNNENMSRSLQLLNRSNQMNFITRRLTETDLRRWLSEGERLFWTYRVSDRFGDSGITGILSHELLKQKNAVRVYDFVLSCRVMGRKIEEAMIFTVLEYAKEQGLDRIKIHLKPTEKNKPSLEFIKKMPFTLTEEDGVYQMEVNNEIKLPECISLTWINQNEGSCSVSHSKLIKENKKPQEGACAGTF